MFTGLVETTAKVLRNERQAGSVRLDVEGQGFADFDCKFGDSIAVNGCCLTVTSDSPLNDRVIRFDISSESLGLTNLGKLNVGQLVNLERALRIGDRLGGHLVTGHIDGMAKVVEWRAEQSSWHLLIDLPAHLAKYCVVKGSLCLNGISLTINDLIDNDSGALLRFTIIPETVAKTSIGNVQPGTQLNVEVDQLAKFAERLR